MIGLPDQRCWYCGTLFNQTRFNVEHQTPSSRGGSNDDSNKVLACVGCNSSKRNRNVEEFRAPIARRNNVLVEEVHFYGESGRPIFAIRQEDLPVSPKYTQVAVDELILRLKQFVSGQKGGLTGAAKRLNLSRMAVASVLSGLGVHRGTISQLREKLALHDKGLLP